MADVEHRNLTGASLHEPKGVESAGDGEVYVADGEGSGVWQSLSIPSGGFSMRHTFYLEDGSVDWVKPSNHIGSLVTLIGCGGKANELTNGPDSTFKSLVAGGGVGGAQTGNAAGGVASGGDVNKNGGAADYNGATNTDTPGIPGGVLPYIYSTIPFGMGAHTTNNHTSDGGGGAMVIKWYDTSDMSSTETVTVGSVAHAQNGTDAGRGVALIIDYIKVT